MTDLKRLQDRVRPDINQEFREGESEIEDLDIYVEEIDQNISLEDFNDRIDETMEKFEAGDTDMDPFLAPKIHQSLQMDLQLASDPGIWNYLTIVQRPDFVRHRWTNYPMERFWATPKLTRNAFAILWWTAEITSDGDNYEATKKVLGTRDLALQVIDNSFSHIHVLAKILGRELGDEPGWVSKGVAKELNSRLSTRVPEFMSEEQLEDLILTIKEDVKEEDRWKS